jgi:hypothetical protein
MKRQDYELMVVPERLESKASLSPRQAPGPITASMFWWAVIGISAIGGSYWLQSQPMDVSGILRAVGILACTLVLVRLRSWFSGARSHYRVLLVGMLGWMGISIALVPTWRYGPLTLMNSMTVPLFIVVLLLFAGHMSRVCTKLGWCEAGRNWRVTVWLGVVCLVLPIIACCLIDGLGWGLGIEVPEVVLPHFEFLLVLQVVRSLPVFMLIRAVLISAEAAAKHDGYTLPRSLHSVRRVPAMGLLLSLLLTPAWMLLPAIIHYRLTPTFDEFVRAHPGEARLPDLPDDYVLEGAIHEVAFRSGEIQPPDDNPDVRHLHHLCQIRFGHGEEVLADLELALVVQFREQPREVLGIHKQWIKHYLDPRFHAVARFLDEFPEDLRVGQVLDPRTKRDSSEGWEIPIRVELCLASGAGDLDAQIAGARNLPRTKDLVSRWWERHLPRVLRAAGRSATGIIYFDRDALSLEWGANSEPRSGTRLWNFPDQPPPGEGLQYHWTLSGVLCLSQGGPVVLRDERKGKEVFNAGQFRLVESDIEMNVNYDEYSYGWYLDNVHEFWVAGNFSEESRHHRHWETQRTYHGRVW